jgi:hypothetical protein
MSENLQAQNTKLLGQVELLQSQLDEERARSEKRRDFLLVVSNTLKSGERTLRAVGAPQSMIDLVRGVYRPVDKFLAEEGRR